MNEIFGISYTQYIVIIFTVLIVYFIMRESEMRNKIYVLAQMADLISEFINDPNDVQDIRNQRDLSYLVRLFKNDKLRSTIIRGDGVVLFDSAIRNHKEIENQLSRPEIRDALVYGRGISIRDSLTSGVPELFLAQSVPTQFGTLYIRLSSPLSKIRQKKGSYAMLIIIALSGIIIAKMCK